MTWIALGGLMFVGGILMLWAGQPSGPAHRLARLNGLVELLYVFSIVLLIALGFGMAVRGAVDLVA